MHLPSVSSRFKTSTAAGALAAALIAVPAPAVAAELCGPLSGTGAVECEIGDGAFNEGISYVTDGNLLLGLEDGLAINPDAGIWGIAVVSNYGSVSIDGAGASIKAQDSLALSVIAAGNIDVAIGDVETSGDFAAGIATMAYEGDTNLNVGNVTTDGDFGYGIIAESLTGSITISAGDVSTSGYSADGIIAFTAGDINIEAGSVSGNGDYTWGVTAMSGGWTGDGFSYGDTNVEVGSIAISGDNVVGAVVVSYGDANVKIDELTINGNYSNGVAASGLGDVSVEVGDATFTGMYSGGIVASSYGTATVKVGTLSTEHGGGVVAYGVEGAHAEAGTIAVNGDFANGIQGVTMFGDATVKVGEVSTNGVFAVAVNGDAMKGHLLIEAGKITTQGDLAMGIRAFGKDSIINVSGPISTNGMMAFGILNSTTHGDAIVRTAGAITTAGEWADALWITGRYGTADIQTSGKVSTSGNYSYGIAAHGEDGQVKIVAGEIETGGEFSDGIYARTRYVEFFLGQPPVPDPVEFTGNIDIKVESLKVTGTGSTGISARGLGAANIDVGMVSALDGYAIETNMIEDSSIKVRKSATSANGSAILVEGEDTFVTVASGATVTGAEHGIIIKAVGDRCVMPNPTDGSRNPCPNPGDIWGYPDPEPVPDVAPGLATIDNAGTISGGTGYAVKVENGTLTLNNSGTIQGAVLLGIGDDVINNSGSFVVTKDSEFGLGNDLFKNSGVLKFGNSTTLAAAAAAEFTLVGLEKFENSGTIDLTNGVAGDTLTLPGSYVGSGEGTLAVDVDFTGNSSDMLVVAGAATGTTQVAINVTAGQAQLSGDTGIKLVEVGTGSAADAFVIAKDRQDVGFIRYGLVYDAASSSYVLAAAAGSGAFRQLNALEGLGNNWHASANAVRTNVTAARDDHWINGETANRHRLWGQVQGGKTKRDGETKGSDPIAFDYEQDRTGVQLGFDLVGSQGDNGGVRFGVTGGYADSKLDSKVAKERTDIETVNFGAYASVTHGKLFGSLLAQYDKHDVKFDSQAAGFEAKADGKTFGVEIEGGAHLAAGSSFFIEPLASLAWTSTSLDDLEALGQSLDFDDASGIRGKLGVRFGGHSQLGGSALRYYGSAKAVHDFGGRNSLTLVSDTESQELKADRLGTFGEGVLGAAYVTKGGLEAFFEGQGEFGSDYDSLEGRVGVRLKL